MNNLTDCKGAWQLNGTKYRFIEISHPSLPAGYYKPVFDYPEWLLQAVNVKFDTRVEVMDEVTTKVIESVKKFWNASKIYAELGSVHKRGIFLYGPPGTGKSMTVNALTDMVVENNGIVILAGQNSIQAVENVIHYVRSAQTKSPIVVVMEDIESLLRDEAQQKALLALMSGQRQVGNVLYLATTNLSLEEIDALCPALINRPSRFDIIEKVDFPTDMVKTTFLKGFSNKLTSDVIDKIAKDTKNCSIAHVKEIVLSHLAMNEPIDTAITRISKMKMTAPVVIDEEDDD